MPDAGVLRVRLSNEFDKQGTICDCFWGTKLQNLRRLALREIMQKATRPLICARTRWRMFSNGTPSASACMIGRATSFRS